MVEDFRVPLDKIVKSILGNAVDNGAKEIHIQLQAFDAPVQEEITGLPIPLSFARREGTVVTFRVAGAFEQQMKLPHFMLQPLLTRVQELSDAKTSEVHGFPEGHLSFEHDSRHYNWRVLVGPNEFGEKLVLRRTQH